MRTQFMRPVVEDFTQVADVNPLASDSFYQTLPGRDALDPHRKVCPRNQINLAQVGYLQLSRENTQDK